MMYQLEEFYQYIFWGAVNIQQQGLQQYTEAKMTIGNS